MPDRTANVFIVDCVERFMAALMSDETLETEGTLNIDHSIARAGEPLGTLPEHLRRVYCLVRKLDHETKALEEQAEKLVDELNDAINSGTGDAAAIATKAQALLQEKQTARQTERAIESMLERALVERFGESEGTVLVLREDWMVLSVDQKLTERHAQKEALDSMTNIPDALKEALLDAIDGEEGITVTHRDATA